MRKETIAKLVETFAPDVFVMDNFALGARREGQGTLEQRPRSVLCLSPASHRSRRDRASATVTRRGRHGTRPLQAKRTVTDFYLGMIRMMEIAPGESVLVVCGEARDREAFLDAGIENVTISNIDDGRNTGDFAPYPWERQDAENLDLADGAYDWVVVHAGLHHCASPHRALCEMLRVARKGIMVIESRDSLAMRAAVRLGLTYDFELEPVALSDGAFGGYRNTSVPNYVYRWTEREVIKTTLSFVPDVVMSHRFAYGYRMPLQRMAMARNPLKRSAVMALGFLKRVFETILPKQGNQFGFIVTKTERLQPWLNRGDGGVEVDPDYVNRIYDTGKFVDQPERPGSRPGPADHRSRAK